MTMMRIWTDPNTNDAFRLSIASLIFTLLAVALGIKLYMMYGSSLCLVFAFENCVDFLSSAIVLWRFFAPSSSDLNDATIQKLNRRETRASVAISFVMVLLGVVITVASVNDFMQNRDDPAANETNLAAVILMSVLSFFIFGTLTAIKFQYADKLDSPSLQKDGVCSLIGVVLSVALFFTSIVVFSFDSVWFIDPLVSLLAGVYAMYLGVLALQVAKDREGLPIFSKSWWIEGKDEGDSPGVELPSSTESEKEIL